MKRSRRDFMRQLLGGGAAALVGATIPVGLGPDEMALVGERVVYGFKDDVLTITNLTNEPIEVYATYGYQIDSPELRFRNGGWIHVPEGELTLNLGDPFHQNALAS